MRCVVFPPVIQLSFSGAKCIASLSKSLAFNINAEERFLLLKPSKRPVSGTTPYPHFLFLFCSKSITLLYLSQTSAFKIYEWTQHFWFPLQTQQMVDSGWGVKHPRHLCNRILLLWRTMVLVAWAARPSGEEGKVLRKESCRYDLEV